MFDEKAALLDRIRETNHITDNTTRLVFSDWLEENEKLKACPGCGRTGEIDDDIRFRPSYRCTNCNGTGYVSNGFKVRAEFIRVQCGIFDEVEDPDTDWSECTGVAASWCPNCGDCCCESREDSMSDDHCPLHSVNSNHDRLSLLIGKEIRLIEDHWPDLSNFGKYGPAFFDRGLVTTAAVPLALWLSSGARAVRDQPIVTARLTDRFPLAFGRYFCWHNADNPMRGKRVSTYPTADYLPEWIFNRLTGYLMPQSGTNNLMWAYRTRDQADQALKAIDSECLLRWAFDQQETE